MRHILLFLALAVAVTSYGQKNQKKVIPLGDTTYKAYTDSLTRIGDTHFFDTGNFKTAINYYLVAYENGGVDAAFMLGRCFAEGVGVDYDMEKATSLWVQAAAAGSSDAALQIAEHLVLGIGVKKDVASALKWYERAHELGSLDATHMLGVYYRNGIVVEKDVDKALELWRKAADGGVMKAQEALGLEYYEGTNTRRNMLDAVKYLKMAADQGAPKAAFYAGLCCEKSYGLPGEDYVSAAYYYMVAADADIPEAQVRLANLYLTGQGVEQNTERANYWLIEAQKNGAKIDSEE